jgi:hypothetical protein
MQVRKWDAAWQGDVVGFFGIGIRWMEKKEIIEIMSLPIIYETIVYKLSKLLYFKYLYSFFSLINTTTKITCVLLLEMDLAHT